MKVDLPDELERALQAAVLSGRFASVDDAMAEAVRLLLREMTQRQAPATPSLSPAQPDPVLGCLRDAADEWDAIVEDAMRKRRQETWRDIAVE